VQNNPLEFCGFWLDIMNSKETEVALQTREEQLANILHSAMDAVITIDENQNIILFNTAAEEMFHRAAGEVIGQSLDQIIPERFLAQHQEHIRLFGETNATNRRMGQLGSISGLRANGEEFPIEASNSKVVTEDQKLFTVILRDITQRKLNEEALQRQAVIFENMYDGVFLTDMEGYILDWNPAAEQMFGYSKMEMLGKTPAILHLSEKSGNLAKTINEGMKRTGRWSGEIPFVRKDRTQGICETIVVPLYDEHGQMTATIRVNRDITERKQAAEDLAQLSRQQELILSSAGEGICGLDLDGRMTFVNPAAARMIGWTPEELIGKSQHDVLHHTRLDGTPYPREKCPIHAAFKDGAIHHIEHEVFWRKDGTSFPVDYTTTPIRSDRGSLIGAVVTFRDTTRRKQAEEDLKFSAQQLQEALEERTRISRDLHDHILQSLYAEYLLLASVNMPMLNHDPEEGFRHIEQATRQLNITIKEIREFIDSLHFIPHDFDFLASLHSLVRGMTLPSSVKFQVMIDPDAAQTLPMDHKVNLLNIAREAIGNCLRHAMATEGKIALKIHGSTLRFEMEDNGVGFDSEAKKATGHGLRNMKALAEKIGGDLQIFAIPDQGTRLVVDFSREVVRVE